jgi:hypothetical protein
MAARKANPLLQLRKVAGAFAIEGDFHEIWTLSGGHIHTTWSFTTDHGCSFVAQEINTSVFPDLGACADNLSRIDDHFASRDLGIFIPAHVRTETGSVHATLDDGSTWRVTRRVDDVVAPQQINSADEAFAAAAAFGSYVGALRSLPGPPLRATIARFHDFAWRVEQLREAVRTDRAGRASSVGPELDEAEALATTIAAAAAAVAADNRHAVHNDAKVTNLLCSVQTGRPVAIVDLDTTMPGSPLMDLGELVRSGASERPEDARDLDQIEVRWPIVCALTDGFSSTAGLTEEQRARTNDAGPILAIENGLRFLADHLNGDVYFHASRPKQNLDRARVQFRLTRQLLLRKKR